MLTTLLIAIGQWQQRTRNGDEDTMTVGSENNAPKARKVVGRPFQPGNSGRPKGIPNKLTMEVKALLGEAIEQVGGLQRLVAWVQADDQNERLFWSSMVPKLLPLQVNGTHEHVVDADGARRAAEEAADRVIAQLAVLGGTQVMPDQPGVLAGIRVGTDRLQ